MLTNRQGDCVTRICDECGDIKINVSYWNLYKKDIHKCYKCGNKNKNLGKIPHNKGKQSVPKHIGNIHAHSDGYPMMWIGSANGSYMPVHRLVASYELNRLVTREEKVHHIDGDKENYNTYNVFVCENMSHHKKIHAQLENIAMELVRKELISFNKNTGEYYMSDKLLDLYKQSNSNKPDDNFILKDLVSLFYNICE